MDAWTPTAVRSTQNKQPFPLQTGGHTELAQSASRLYMFSFSISARPAATAVKSCVPCVCEGQTDKRDLEDAWGACTVH